MIHARFAIGLVAVRIVATRPIDDDFVTAGVDDRVETLTVAAPVEHVTTDLVATDLGLETARAVTAIAVAALIVVAAGVIAGTLLVGTALTIHNLIVATGLNVRVIASATTALVEQVATDAIAAHLW
jgi:hypothetical protein